MKLLVVTPVKDSLATTVETIKSINGSKGDFSYCIFNDLSNQETENYLTESAAVMQYKLINLVDHVTTPSPNYLTVLRMAQDLALKNERHLVIVESDVIVATDTLSQLNRMVEELDHPGMIGSVTVDRNGKINFPYKHISASEPDVIKTNRSLSFCCTLITRDFLKAFDFDQLSEEKDWFDVTISKKSRSLGFNNYVIKKLPVVHQPHSSRPWKQEKYSSPIKYYLKKFFLGRDRI